LATVATLQETLSRPEAKQKPSNSSNSAAIGQRQLTQSFDTQVLRLAFCGFANANHHNNNDDHAEEQN
jgi:hypothetical protein